ncbi:MAG TPA: glycoside hydrolase family 38 C-terminal domain-containing protein, partial [Candidatus Acidoferrales bacterium]|nr:glycoside hydrolase family 38 C-terminal domain-containing protein [Candidatus Acidoferrales bacterium]
VDGALEVPFDLGASRATMRVALGAGDAFLRVDLAVDWRERRTLLRLENWLTADGGTVRYGAPHGSIERTARADTPYERARFEVPGQRFAMAGSNDGNAVACLALDTYGWSARVLDAGGIHLGHSLLRSTTWPDPRADRGEHSLSWAFAPLRDASIGEIERLWLEFAGMGGVRLFTSEDANVAVAACKPAQDGDGVIVRVRECNGTGARAAVRSGGRVREAKATDALERPLDDEVTIHDESLVFSIAPYALRSFRVRF